MKFVGLDDSLHELVPHDVLVPELDERDPVDVARRMSRTWISPDACSRGRSICVTSPVTTIFEPKPSRVEEHLHLLRCRVLCLVRYGERVVERATAHERERRHLDRGPVHVRREPVGVHRVVERVEEGAHVRIDLREHVTGQEAEPLARLDGRSCEDDPADLLLRGAPATARAIAR